MFTKQNLVATLVGGVAMFILGYLIWGMATMSFFQEHTFEGLGKGEDEMDLISIFLGNLFGAFALSTLYRKWSRGHHSAGEGFKFGAWIGFLIGVGMGLVWYGTSKMMDGTGYAVEAVLEIVYYGIIGVIIALVYKALAKKEAA